jgi:hypothetical protein
MLRHTVSLLFGLSLAVLVSAQDSLAQSISIFGNAVPSDPTGGGKTVTLGVKFWSSQSGAISAIRFYRAAVSSQGYVARLYTAGGTLLGSATLAQDSGPVPGWQVANFSSPIPISANTTYVAAYYCPVGEGAGDSNGLSNGVTNGVLTAPASSMVGGNGVYNPKNAFPSNSHQASNYYVDVLFIPTAAILSLSFNPPNPSIPANASARTIVTTITATWSDGSPFTGTLGFGGTGTYSNDNGTFAISGTNLILNSSVSGDANTVQNVTIVAAQ